MEYLQYLEYVNYRPPRIQYRHDQDPFNDLTDTEFQERYRFSKQTTEEIIRLLTPRLQNVEDPRAPYAIPYWKKILLSLRYFAHGTYHRDTGDLSGVSESLTCETIHKVALAICEELRPIYIKFPTDEYAIRTKRKFFDSYGFPGVLSCVDGSHIPIICPSTPDKEEYRNRKGYFSINVMGACGADLEFTNIVARWKGSTHDSRVLKNSALYSRFENNDMDGFLIGDRGYGCNRFLMTPLVNPNNASEWRYQRALIRTRSCVERMFGLWKSRFRCVHTENMLRFEPRRSCNIIVACAVLHNIGIRHEQWGDCAERDEQDDDDVVLEENDDDLDDNDVEGVRSRADLIRRHFS